MFAATEELLLLMLGLVLMSLAVLACSSSKKCYEHTPSEGCGRKRTNEVRPQRNHPDPLPNNEHVVIQQPSTDTADSDVTAPQQRPSRPRSSRQQSHNTATQTTQSPRMSRADQTSNQAASDHPQPSNGAMQYPEINASHHARPSNCEPLHGPQPLTIRCDDGGPNMQSGTGVTPEQATSNVSMIPLDRASNPSPLSNDSTQQPWSTTSPSDNSILHKTASYGSILEYSEAQGRQIDPDRPTVKNLKKRVNVDEYLNKEKKKMIANTGGPLLSNRTTNHPPRRTYNSTDHGPSTSRASGERPFSSGQPNRTTNHHPPPTYHPTDHGPSTSRAFGERPISSGQPNRTTNHHSPPTYHPTDHGPSTSRAFGERPLSSGRPSTSNLQSNRDTNHHPPPTYHPTDHGPSTSRAFGERPISSGRPSSSNMQSNTGWTRTSNIPQSQRNMQPLTFNTEGSYHYHQPSHLAISYQQPHHNAMQYAQMTYPPDLHEDAMMVNQQQPIDLDDSSADSPEYDDNTSQRSVVLNQNYRPFSPPTPTSPAMAQNQQQPLDSGDSSPYVQEDTRLIYRATLPRTPDERAAFQGQSTSSSGMYGVPEMSSHQPQQPTVPGRVLPTPLLQLRVNAVMAPEQQPTGPGDGYSAGILAEPRHGRTLPPTPTSPHVRMNAVMAYEQQSPGLDDGSAEIQRVPRSGRTLPPTPTSPRMLVSSALLQQPSTIPTGSPIVERRAGRHLPPTPTASSSMSASSRLSNGSTSRQLPSTDAIVHRRRQSSGSLSSQLPMSNASVRRRMSSDQLLTPSDGVDSIIPASSQLQALSDEISSSLLLRRQSTSSTRNAVLPAIPVSAPPAARWSSSPPQRTSVRPPNSSMPDLPPNSPRPQRAQLAHPLPTRHSRLDMEQPAMGQIPEAADSPVSGSGSGTPQQADRPLEEVIREQIGGRTTTSPDFVERMARSSPVVVMVGRLDHRPRLHRSQPTLPESPPNVILTKRNSFADQQ